MIGELEAPLILASASRSRRALLEQAGLDLEVVPAAVDERALRRQLEEKGGVAAPAPRDVALHLAAEKAREVSRRRPEAIVIGADQVLALGKRIFEKPRDLNEARATLEALAGESHALHSAVAVARAGAVVWRSCESACLTMRALGEGEIARYLARAGEAVCQSVGAYQLEGLGVQLFERIEGDYFTILGLPLLPLLGYLRTCAGGQAARPTASVGGSGREA